MGGGGGLTGVLFCFGLGYSAAVLARRLRARGWEVRDGAAGQELVPIARA